MLELAEQGDAKAGEQLFALLYDELRRLAARKMANERPGQTLQPTALVHEAWLRLGGANNQEWQSRAHFFSAAAEAMRRILVERARRKQRLRHGGSMERTEFDEEQIASPLPDEDLLALDEALNRLVKLDPRAAELVQLCFFAGLTQAAAAQQLGVSVATAERTWACARAWLFREIRKELNPSA